MLRHFGVFSNIKLGFEHNFFAQSFASVFWVNHNRLNKDQIFGHIICSCNGSQGCVAHNSVALGVDQNQGDGNFQFVRADILSQTENPLTLTTRPFTVYQLGSFLDILLGQFANLYLPDLLSQRKKCFG
ncbi:hypothetical protein BpHYR1_014481 [Brachionus plicatilis]|uniref:Uncharacterized protein n=1 Tax=Brachionus plicatilis TaxID=10195 RepID=A0A3M7RAM1_BRAPC|nr:hypothetical protein BpHYR1_014481 [Brachionus plicatilis]